MIICFLIFLRDLSDGSVEMLMHAFAHISYDIITSGIITLILIL